MKSNSAPFSPFRIAIVGGGLGGVFSALSIHHHLTASSPKPITSPIQIAVYEQAPNYREIGAGVGIGSNAARLFEKLGLLDAVHEISGSTNGVWLTFLRFDDGREVLTVPQTQVEGEGPKVRNLTVQRKELLDVLLRAARERGAATLYTQKCCQRVTKVDNEMVMYFMDGTTASADLIVGCDGIHSSIRASYVADVPRYSGRIAWRGLVDIEKIKPYWPHKTFAISWVGRGRYFLTYPIGENNRLLNIVGFVAKSEKELGDLRESWTSEGEIGDLKEDFKGFEGTVQRVIDEMQERPSKWIINDRDPLPQWVFEAGGVVLLGDAAHAMVPLQGAGAGQAIEDGYILGLVIRDFFKSTNKNLQQWLQLYQDVRLPRAQKVQSTSREAGNLYDMQEEEMKDKSLEECFDIVKAKTEHRLKWIWAADLESVYEEAKSEAGLS